MPRPIQLLAIVPDEWLTAIRDVLTAFDIAISFANNRKSAIFRLGIKPEIEVVLTASMLPDGTWKDVLSDTLRLQRPPQVVVAARYGDSSLWCEVLDHGGYDLAAYPFNPGVLQRTLISAAVECQLERNLADTGI
jgi:DNA-binding NtrC family response regulator